MWYNYIQKGGSKMFTSDVIDALKDLNKQFGNNFCIDKIFITCFGTLHVEFCNKEYFYDKYSFTWEEIVKE
jgi:hypothetical protein